MESRKQFTLYESMYKSLKRIKNAEDRAQAYDIICAYAFYKTEPDLDSVADSVAIAFELIRPVLDTASKKAENGKAGGSKPKANDKQSESKTENTSSEKEKEKEVEIEIEIEKDIEKESKKQSKNSGFELFWEAYPKKVGKDKAKESWKKASKVEISVILSAIEQQKQSVQWQKDNGQYIPNPATWLNQGRWQDEITPVTGYVDGCNRAMDSDEIAAIQRMFENG